MARRRRLAVGGRCPYLAHPDWLNRTARGETFDGKDYSFDPGHAAVQAHLFTVAMDLVSRYELDGLHLDYLRYPGRNWGYSSNAVERFNRRYSRQGQPAPEDPLWSQFRREQVSALLRKVYLCAMEIRPGIKLSVATVTWPPAPSTESEWLGRAAAYNDVHQDWRSWMEEGIVDMNIPMIYVPHDRPEYRALFGKWTEFAAAHRYNRHVVIGPALFLNAISNSVAQVRAVRQVAVKTAIDGVCLYYYATFSSEPESREAFREALTRRGRRGELAPVFAEAVGTPDMPWKSRPVTGHLKGFVHAEQTTNTLDGAAVVLQGPKSHRTVSDATGFYGAVDLPPGEYTVELAGSATSKKPVRIEAGKVATVDLSAEK
mgnify:FL=1